jgi:hypothetical protein
MEIEGSFPQFGRSTDNNTDLTQTEICNPPTWLSTSDLEDELQTAMWQAAVDGAMGHALAEVDAYFEQEDEETPTAYRRSLLRLLSLLRPQLADLLGWVSAKER